MTSAPPPPGWYPNPQCRNGYAYWDGTRWHMDMRRSVMPWWLVVMLSLVGVLAAAIVIDYMLSH